MGWGSFSFANVYVKTILCISSWRVGEIIEVSEILDPAWYEEVPHLGPWLEKGARSLSDVALFRCWWEKNLDNSKIISDVFSSGTSQTASTSLWYPQSQVAHLLAERVELNSSKSILDGRRLAKLADGSIAIVPASAIATDFVYRLYQSRMPLMAYVFRDFSTRVNALHLRSRLCRALGVNFDIIRDVKFVGECFLDGKMFLGETLVPSDHTVSKAILAIH